MSQAGILRVEDSILPPDVPLTFLGNTGPGSSAIDYLMNIVGVGSVSVDTTGNNITISMSGGGFSWQTVTSVSPPNPIQIVAGNGYICDGVSLVTFLLPLAPSLGQSFTIISNTAKFSITENGSQQMRIGAALTTAGSGTANSNTVGDYVEMIYVGSNLFISKSPQGTITLS